jgi:hypothetical protein
MRQVILSLSFAIALGAQSPDPADLMPADTPIFVDAEDLSAAAGTVAASPQFVKSDTVLTGLGNALRELSKMGFRRGAFGYSPAAIGSDKWIVVLETEDSEGALAMIRSWTTATVASARVEPFLVVTNGDKLLKEVVELRDGKGKPLADRPDFKVFRATVGTSVPIRFHVDVQQMWPRAFRSHVRNSSNIWSVILCCHVNHVLKTVGALSGSITMKDGARASVRGDIKATESRSVTEGNPSQGVLAAPRGTAFRMSVPRNLGNFWTRRKQLLPEAAEATVGELEKRVASGMPGWTVETLVSELGEAFDVYVAPGGSESEPGTRPPAVALVATVPDSANRCQMDVLRPFFGIVGATLDGEAVPTGVAFETQCHRGVELSLAPGVVMAKAGGRVIVSNQKALTTSLIDAALDRQQSPRTAGDELVAYGGQAARVIGDSKHDLSSGWLASRLGSEARARKFLDVTEAVLKESRDARFRFDLEGKQVVLEIEVTAPIRDR